MEIARLYRAAHASFVDVVRELSADEWARRVPCLPGWTVRDVLSHVAGVVDDTLHGRLEGVATEPWTAAQVDRWRDTPSEELLAQWGEQTERVAGVYESVDQALPVFDCHTHEHDVRQALDRPGNRDHEIIAILAASMSRRAVGRPVAVSDGGASVANIAGEGDPIEVSGVSAFELVRSRLGRRSRDQVAGYEWSAAPTAAELDAWFLFGPSAVPIVE